jgi:hypothetical protein
MKGMSEEPPEIKVQVVEPFDTKPWLESILLAEAELPKPSVATCLKTSTDS